MKKQNSNNPTALPAKLKTRTLWISDVHLGSRDCKAEFLIDLLSNVKCETLYLVGDIVDLWALKRRIYWPDSHNQLVRKILKLSKKGTRVIYIPGNHDDPARALVGEMFGSVEVHRRYIHETATGQRLLVLHGDEFDGAIRYSHLLRKLGDASYYLLLYLNRFSNRLRRFFGYSYYSLARHIKTRIGKAENAIHLFEDAAFNEIERSGVDGIVCGHIHHAALIRRGGKIYCNDGDWVESCTALVETMAGELELIHWADDKNRLSSLHPSPAPTTVVPLRKVA